jgi:hypothetical protein
MRKILIISFKSNGIEDGIAAGRNPEPTRKIVDAIPAPIISQ